MTSIRIHSNIDLKGDNREILNLELEKIAGDPVIQDQGAIWFNTILNKISYVESINPVIIRRLPTNIDIDTLTTNLASVTTNLASEVATRTSENLILTDNITAAQTLAQTAETDAQAAQSTANTALAIANNAEVNNKNIPDANVGGTEDAITLTPILGIISYIEGQEFIFKAKYNNLTANCTINISNLGALLTHMGNVAMPIGGLILGDLYRVRIEGSGTFTARVTPYDAVSANGDTVNGTLSITGNLELSSIKGAGILNGNNYGWRDLIGFLNPLKSGTTGYPTIRLFYDIIEEYSHSVNDKGKVSFHLPHDYAPNTDLFIHLHWGHNGTACNGNFIVELTCTYAKGHNQATGIFNIPILTNVTVVATTANTPQYMHRVDEIQLSAAIPSGSLLDTALLEPDGMILVQYKVTSIPTISGGTTVEPFIFSIDIHHQSTNMTTKNKAPDFYI